MIIDIIGGLLIGVASYKMNIGQAARVYSILTVGDGLVSQLPALIISTASGIIVSRAASDTNFGKELSFQFLTQPKIFAIASGVLLFLGVIPGLPTVPFLFMAGVSGVIAYVNRSSMGGEQEPLETEQETEEEPAESLEELMEIDPMGLEISHTLIPLVNPDENGTLLDRIKLIRRECALDMGFIIPSIRIRDNIQLRPGDYNILVRGAKVASGKLVIGSYLAMNPGIAVEPIEGIETKEPAYGYPAYWITEDDRPRAEALGYTIVDAVSVLATHLTEIIRIHADEFLDRQNLQALIDRLKEDYPVVVDELLTDNLGLGDLLRVCRNLLSERISIRDLAAIFETIADYVGVTKDPDMLTEYVRAALSRTISSRIMTPEGVVKVITLAPGLENLIESNLRQTAAGQYPVLAPEVYQKFIETLVRMSNQVRDKGHRPVLLVGPKIRLPLARLVGESIKDLSVVSYAEIVPDVGIESIGILELNADGNAN